MKKQRLKKLSFRSFLRLYKQLADLGWTRKDNDIKICLKSPRGRDFSFSPLSAVLFHLTGHKYPNDECGTLYRAFQKVGYDFWFDDLWDIDHWTYRPAVLNMDWKIKGPLQKLIPVDK